jgi:hypothetical protein
VAAAQPQQPPQQQQHPPKQQQQQQHPPKQQQLQPAAAGAVQSSSSGQSSPASSGAAGLRAWLGASYGGARHFSTRMGRRPASLTARSPKRTKWWQRRLGSLQGQQRQRQQSQRLRRGCQWRCQMQQRDYRPTAGEARLDRLSQHCARPRREAALLHLTALCARC